ncbi:hypothetical protein ACFQ4C_14765 [Larkinella insperata]|uniref:J domain-containing protein n=1 Tax=Larkinella insperata TaxID=332158 RepID=A0ABW3QMS2_9BACT|nr:hypothetical protein [Larkinella insperata]
MKHIPQQLIRIGSAKNEANLSKSQREFNRLTQQIETLEKELAEYRAASDRIEQRIQTELLPLQREYHQQQASLVHLFDRAYESGEFKANERKKLADLIRHLAFDLIAEYGFNELKPLYDKYDPDGFDTAARSAEEPKSVRQPPEEPPAPLEEEPWQAEQQPPPRPKSQKKLDREARKQLEERNTTKAVRTVYMDLVKAFHPDREPDETEKLRKTEIMQRITEAYEKSDLMALLRLQLEFNRIDQDHLETLAEQQVKYYNKILNQQTQELAEQVASLQWRLSVLSGRTLPVTVSPASLEHRLKADVQELKRAIKNLKSELTAFQSTTVLNQWLKSYRM